MGRLKEERQQTRNDRNDVESSTLLQVNNSPCGHNQPQELHAALEAVALYCPWNMCPSAGFLCQDTEKLDSVKSASLLHMRPSLSRSRCARIAVAIRQRLPLVETSSLGGSQSSETSCWRNCIPTTATAVHLCANLCLQSTAVATM